MLMKGSSRVSRRKVCEIADFTERPASLRILGDERQSRIVSAVWKRYDPKLVPTTCWHSARPRIYSARYHRKQVRELLTDSVSGRCQSVGSASSSRSSCPSGPTFKDSFVPRKRSLQLAKCDKSRSIAKPFRDRVVFGSASTGVDMRT